MKNHFNHNSYYTNLDIGPLEDNVDGWRFTEWFLLLGKGPPSNILAGGSQFPNIPVGDQKPGPLG